MKPQGLLYAAALLQSSSAFIAPGTGASSQWLGQRQISCAATHAPVSYAHDNGARGLVMRKGRKSPRKMLNELKGPGAAKSVDANATWLQVLNTDKEVGAEQGSTKLVNGKYAGDDLYFLLVRWGGKMYTVSESCGRCKFPLTDAKITSGDGGAPIMTCPLCGATYDARTGERGAIASQGGLKDAFAGMMAQKEPKDLRAYETRVTPDGAVVVRMQ